MAKTTAKLEASLILKIKELHPYELPCILSFNIDGGEPKFLKWLSNILD